MFLLLHEVYVLALTDILEYVDDFMYQCRFILTLEWQWNVDCR